MFRIATPIAAVALLGLASAVSAEPVAGVVQSFDSTSRTLTLDDGTIYKLHETVVAPALQPGSTVTLNVEPMNGELTVDRISVE